MRYRTIPALLAAVFVLVAAGCTENPPASRPSSTPTSATASPRPSQSEPPQPPSMPVEARAKTDAGLRAFASHWMAVKNYMSRTGRSQEFLALNNATCDWCEGLARSYQQVYAAGGFYSGDLDGTISQFHLVRLVQGSRADIQFRAVLPESSRVASKGATPEPLKPALRDYTLNLTYTAQGWKVEQASWKTVGAAS